MLTKSDQLIQDLTRTQHRINASIKYKTDMALYGQADFWEIADRFGDCDDYSLRKRQALIELGYPANELRLAICKDENGEGHAVLTVDVKSFEGARDLTTYVLDNRFPSLMKVDDLRRRGYTFLMRQAADDHRWVETK